MFRRTHLPQRISVSFNSNIALGNVCNIRHKERRPIQSLHLFKCRREVMTFIIGYTAFEFEK